TGTPPRLANQATLYTGTGGNDNYLLRRDISGTRYEILIGGNLTYTLTASIIPSLTFNLGDGNDTLTVPNSLSCPLTFNGGTTPTDQDTLDLQAGSIVYNSDARAGTANLTLHVASGASATFNATQHLAALNIDGTATMPANGNRFLQTRGLSIAP